MLIVEAQIVSEKLNKITLSSFYQKYAQDELHINIIGASPTCFGTSVPSSGSKKMSSLKQIANLHRFTNFYIP
jgi:hypothetical protein